MAKLTKREQQAQALALRGDTDGALAAFADLKRQGDVSASASLAEIAAYRGNWDDVLQHAAAIVAAPTAADVLNVYTDMVLLAARAIAKLGKWADGRKLVGIALDKLSSLPDYTAHELAVQRLSEFISCNGEGSQFEEAAYFAFGEPSDPLEQCKAWFDEALVERAAKPKKRAAAEEDIDYAYALASTYRYYDGALQVFDRARAWPTGFDETLFAAAALARAGRFDEAWDGIRTRLPQWWPMAVTQVAPVDLVADEPLSRLMVSERCVEILRTPRGPFA